MKVGWGNEAQSIYEFVGNQKLCGSCTDFKCINFYERTMRPQYDGLCLQQCDDTLFDPITLKTFIVLLVYSFREVVIVYSIIYFVRSISKNKHLFWISLSIQVNVCTLKYWGKTNEGDLLETLMKWNLKQQFLIFMYTCLSMWLNRFRCSFLLCIIMNLI